MRILKTVLMGFLIIGAGQALAEDSSSRQPVIQVVVNGSTLDRQEVNALISLYGTVQPGRYWYDAVSGLYGMESGPPAGQLHPGLNLGGPLSASASGGGSGRMTGVFINGREIHPMEYLFYQQLFGRVMPGRFWMNAQGMGGYEGGPAMFNVQQALAQANRRGGGGGSHYMEWIGGKPGTHVGTASDGCTYVVQGDYSAESC
ncbi:MAG: hypothetical protein AAFN07_00300 [Pseudomonadota bacterium]